MGDFGYEFDDDNQDERGDGPADLRKAHRAATRRVKELEAQLSERDEKIASLSKRVRSIDIVDLLPKGVSPKVAKLIPDTVDATADAVKAWLDEFGDVFNVKVDGTTDVAEQPVVDEPVDDGGTDEPNLDGEALGALAAFQQASGGSAAPQGALGALLAEAAGADVKTPEEGMALLKKYGLETVTGY